MGNGGDSKVRGPNKGLKTGAASKALKVATSASIGEETTALLVRAGSTRPVSIGMVTQHEAMFALLQSSTLRMCLQHSCSAMVIEVIGMAHNIVGVIRNRNAMTVVTTRH